MKSLSRSCVLSKDKLESSYSLLTRLSISVAEKKNFSGAKGGEERGREGEIQLILCMYVCIRVCYLYKIVTELSIAAVAA